MKKLTLGLLAVAFVLATGVSSVKADEGSLSFWEKTAVTGNFNSSYTYNINNPTIAAGNAVRVFQVRHNNFDLNRAELEIENSPNDWSAFRLDLGFGQDANVSETLGAPGDFLEVQQAYAELTAPVGNGITFKIGQFSTIIGAEVIESAYNYNASRSISFGNAIPFAHTGVLITYPFNDMFSASIGFVNNSVGSAATTVADDNKGKSLLYKIAVTPSDDISLAVQGSYGNETAAQEALANGTILVDFVGTWQATEQFLVQLNADWRNTRNGGDNKTAVLSAVLLAHYDINDAYGVTVRGEWYNDDQAGLFGGLPAAGGTGQLNNDLISATGTLHFYMGDGWETRLEGRFDKADSSSFTKADGTTKKNQITAALEVAYKF